MAVFIYLFSLLQAFTWSKTGIRGLLHEQSALIVIYVDVFMYSLVIQGLFRHELSLLDAWVPNTVSKAGIHCLNVFVWTVCALMSTYKLTCRIRTEACLKIKLQVSAFACRFYSNQHQTGAAQYVEQIQPQIHDKSAEVAVS